MAAADQFSSVYDTIRETQHTIDALRASVRALHRCVEMSRECVRESQQVMVLAGYRVETTRGMWGGAAPSSLNVPETFAMTGTATLDK